MVLCKNWKIVFKKNKKQIVLNMITFCNHIFLIIYDVICSMFGFPVLC